MNFNQMNDNKRQRLNDETEIHTDNTELNTDVSQTMFMDLNEDCLDKIFRYLSIRDLGSIAETCKWFQELAIKTFKCIWKNEVATLHNNSTKDKLDSLRILRQFGDLLLKVNIDFGGNRRNTEFLDIIMDKGSVKLLEIEFSGFTASDRLDKVLSKRNLYRINAHFNNMISLRFGLLSDNLIVPNCIQQAFSNLQHLSLQHPFNNRHLASFIRFNPQLRSLEFGHDYSFVDRDLMNLINRLLPNLEELKFMEVKKHLSTTAYQPLFLKNLKRLLIRDMKNGKFLPNLSISNKKVEELDIEVFSCNDKLIDTVCQYKAVQKLTLNCLTNNFRGTNLMKFSEHLPQLTELELRGYNESLPMENILQFIQEAANLTTLSLLQFTIDVEEIKEKLDPDHWNVSQSHQQLLICKKF